jgi:SAM-dependent MidA family methyltransferase
VWLDSLPEIGSFTGVVLANELLDALPVRAFALEYGVVFERGVVWNELDSSWSWAQRLANNDDTKVILASLNDDIEIIKDQPRYELERGEQASAWVTSVATCIQRGAMLLIDYGFSASELYHPQRSGGTLMAHRLHQATPNVLAHVGDADITAHVDFTAVAQVAVAQGLALAGFVNQARFLINAGIAQTFMKATDSLDAVDIVAQAQLSRGMQLLMSEAEMGELFKVIAFTRDCPAPLGFERGDRSGRLLPEIS